MSLVVLLRGVNVGGHKTFRPTQLAKQLADLDVVNIGAAGTFVVRARVTQTRLRAAFASRLPFDTEIVICRGREVLDLASQDPFTDHPERKDLTRFVSVLSRGPRSEPSLPVSLPSGGQWLLKVLGREHRFVMGIYRRQMKAIRYLNEIDRLFGVPATTRNWNTVATIAEVLDGSKK